MAGQLTIRRPLLHQTGVYHVLPKLQAFVKTVLIHNTHKNGRGIFKGTHPPPRKKTKPHHFNVFALIIKCCNFFISEDQALSSVVREWYTVAMYMLNIYLIT